mmetsp:Transcript_108281/g.334396  ORF Transcript_108281/g.334396 Transcript_108281/m.334396 type:complete len:310 (-) Transcript_108281:327-1256(-)
MACNRSRAASRAPPSEERVESWILTPPPAVCTEATLLEVSTRPSMACDILMTPWGRERNVDKILWASPLEKASCAGSPVGSAETARPVSSRPNSSRSASARRATASAAAGTASSGSATTARASRGIALCLSPPSMATSSAAGIWESTSEARAPAITTALPRPSWMLMPLWPPSKPRTCSSKATAPRGLALRGAWISSMEFPPPAQPTYTLPNSSVSRFSILVAVTILPSSPNAPVRPVSSSTVKSASIGGSLASGPISRTASAAATPTPLSAPSVVPVAFSHSPSTLSRMGSVAKSCAVPAFFSQTMST